MDDLSNVYIEEVVAPAVRKVTCRIVKIDRQTQLVKHSLNNIVSSTLFIEVELQLPVL